MENKKENKEALKGLLGLIAILVCIAFMLLPVYYSFIVDDTETPIQVLTTEDKIKKQFSVFDGSHIKFKKLLKESRNNKKSFEHIKTTYATYNNYIIVLIEFRSQNLYGGIVRDYAKAKYSINGEFLGIIKNGK